MALAPFFDRIYSAVGMHLSVSRKSLADSLGVTIIGISCGTSLSTNERTIAEMAVNLTARLYPTLAIRGDHDVVQDLKQLASAINPSIEFASEAPGETSICVGQITAQAALYPAAFGWVARLGHQLPLGDGIENPYAASAAAALAASELFRRLFFRSAPEPDLTLSLLDFGSTTGVDTPLSSKSVGDVLFVGAGAVGNAALWALARDTHTSGSLTLVDHETITLSNLQRYALAVYSDVSRPKVEVAREALKNTSFKISIGRSTLEDFRLEGFQCPTTCISVDNVNGRRVAQALLPKLVINGWTGDRALGSSWHRFSDNMACLACLYHPHGQGLSAIQQAGHALGLTEERAATLWVTRTPLSDEERKVAAKKLGVKTAALSPWRNKPLAELYTDVICGAVPIDLPGTGRVEVVPLAHQSVLAGVLMAAELLKRTQSALSAVAQTEPLVSWDDVLKPPPKVWRKPRPREVGCICGDAIYQSVYAAKWSR